MSGNDVTALLKSIGYVYSEEKDAWMLSFAMEKAEWWVKNGCNLDEIPEGLMPIAVERAAGEFLLVKKASGSIDGIDLEAPVKQIKEGDSTVAFAIGEGAKTPEQRLDAAIAHFLRGDDGQFAAHRVLKW